MVKIVVPSVDEAGEIISEHFGRAPYFSWFLVEEGKIVEYGVTPNDSDHFGGMGSPPDKIRSLGGQIVISAGMGIKAINLFQGYNIAVLKATKRGSKENVQEYLKGELEELTEGCLHAQDH